MRTRFAVYVIAFISIVLTVVLVTGCAWPGNHFRLSSLYPQLMKVQDFDFDSDLVFVIDHAGFEWSFHGIEDWHVGDNCLCIMNTNNTEEIDDDFILSVRYAY